MTVKRGRRRPVSASQDERADYWARREIEQERRELWAKSVLSLLSPVNETADTANAIEAANTVVDAFDTRFLIGASS